MMTTALSIFKTGLPEYLRGASDGVTEALTASNLGGRRRISIEGGVFRMLVNGKEVAVNEDRAMNVIIVNAAPHNQREYYASAYVKGQSSAPVCYSNDGITPDERSMSPQAKRCIDCPQNVRGSGQGDSRACRYRRLLAVIPEHEPNKFVYQLSLSATSIFPPIENGKMALQAYAQHLASHRVPITGVVTEIKFDTASGNASKLIFKPIRPVTQEEFELVKELKDSSEVLAAITLNITPQETAPAALTAPIAEPKVVAPKAQLDNKLADLLKEFDD
jgi:hypothetical protein